MVAHAVEDHLRSARLLGALAQEVDFPGDIFFAGVSAHVVGDAEGEHLAAVYALQAERTLRNVRVLAVAGAHPDVVLHAGFLIKHRQHAALAEGIHIIAGDGDMAEAGEKIALADQQLAHERLAGWDIEIRLNPHAADKADASARHFLLHALKERLRVLLEPRVILRAGAGKEKAVVFVQTVERREEGGLHLVIALLPRPQPYGVDVRVSDQIEILHGRSLRFISWVGCRFNYNVWRRRGAEKRGRARNLTKRTRIRRDVPI